MKIEINNIYNVDCYEAIKFIPSKSIDLVLTDPPYGIGMSGGVISKSGTSFGTSPQSTRLYDDKNNKWDEQTPSKEMFDELLRVGKKVIIFGGNYFTDKLPQSNHWLVWDKTGEMQVQNPFSECELIWTNIQERNNVKKYFLRSQGFISDVKDERVHPTQKPLELVKWIIEKYTNENDVVLDVFLGSGTTAVACKETGRNYIGFEIDENFYEIAKDRLNGITQQERREKEQGIMNIFDFIEE